MSDAFIRLITHDFLARNLAFLLLYLIFYYFIILYSLKVFFTLFCGNFFQ